MLREFLVDLFSDVRLLALLGATIAFLAWRRSRAQAELAKRQLEREQAHEQAGSRTDLDAYALVATECVYVENVEEGVARDVKLTILDGKHPLLDNSPAPIPKLRPGERFAFQGVFTMGQLTNCRARLSWTDPDGTLREKIVIIELRPG